MMTPALNASNIAYVAGLYDRYRKNAASVDSSWVNYFRELNENDAAMLAELTGASWTPRSEKLPNEIALPEKKGAKPSAPAANPADLQQAISDAVRLHSMIRAYRTVGHFAANLDPLNIEKPKQLPELQPEHYGFTTADYDRPIYAQGLFGKDQITIRALIDTLRAAYCGDIGYEFVHLGEAAEWEWLVSKIESGAAQQDFSKAEKTQILKDITMAEGLEKFLGKKFVGTKRFGLDGGESTIAGIEEILRAGASMGVVETLFGMAHRGRLNMLTSVLHKPYQALFSEFLGTPSTPADVVGAGDVKYHLGYSSDREFDGNKMHLSITANPSHLEAVNPVVHGKTRAKQNLIKDDERRKVLGVLLHGDAAIAGQGMVAECLMLSDLIGYSTGGTIHVVINNQIGFTTSPGYSRSSPYPTDITKMALAPIFHVNGDNPEAVVHAARMAIEYRQAFGKDAVLDIFCYRRFGHNESDEPAFTQPIMYSVIRDKKSVRTLYAERLIAEGSFTQNETDAIEQDFYNRLEQEFAAAQSYKPNKADWLEGAWQGLSTAPKEDPRRGITGVKEDAMDRTAKAITTVPSDFNINAKIARQLQAKAEMFKGGEGFDWATAEAMAFGTLADEGYRIRLSGQDCGRGTFSQRHAVLTDQHNENRYVPLQHVSEKQADVEIIDSPLSEAAVLGFEYGYTLSDPKALVLWEGQFGDFVNGAQVMIDQFISSAESKWLRMSGLVMLLPHGYEGQGPEHSSARLERFLQQCAEDNMQVANVTTPANYFHILRRQIHRDFRKPLIIMTPKSLLRHKLCVSPLKMFMAPETFHRVLYDDVLPKDNKAVRRVVLCTGKVYYDLLEAKIANSQDDVTFLRLEQIYPFPDDILALELKKYPNAEVIWCQEEPQNMGSWTFVDRRIEAVLAAIKHPTAQRPIYIGRAEAASPATGYAKRHEAEQAALVAEAINTGTKAKIKTAKG
jgi:2-oxoglutarate dehydrogenase E1 component